MSYNLETHFLFKFKNIRENDIKMLSVYILFQIRSQVFNLENQNPKLRNALGHKHKPLNPSRVNTPRLPDN